jgi:hypothetical protein
MSKEEDEQYLETLKNRVLNDLDNSAFGTLGNVRQAFPLSANSLNAAYDHLTVPPILIEKGSGFVVKDNEGKLKHIQLLEGAHVERDTLRNINRVRPATYGFAKKRSLKSKLKGIPYIIKIAFICGWRQGQLNNHFKYLPDTNVGRGVPISSIVT